MQFNSVFTILLIMKKLFILFVLLFSSSAVADDISDFQIEGISIGDSLLDYISEDEIKNEIYENKKSRFTNKNLNFGEVFLPNTFIKSSNYESLYVFVKPEDSKYKIYSISGVKQYETKDQCFIKKEEIVKEFSNLFNNSKIENLQYASKHDPTGKSIIYNTRYIMKSGDRIMVECAIFEKQISIKNNWWETTLRVIIRTYEFREWL